ncbi:MAG TPA: YlxR family protein [Acidimicrobiia bacterium]|nr:YlxR family protein [Acidimicrobiia bacterium]
MRSKCRWERRRPTGDRPRRTCLGCRRVAPQNELIRVYRADHELRLGRGPGRGAWLCREHPGACLDQGRLARALRVPVATGDIERLRAKLEG